tara:strand:- start:57 stop:215 length:159 start_codon:yes stop_codon:yes gene_type:complete
MKLTKIELLVSSDYDNALDTILGRIEDITESEKGELSVLDYRVAEVTTKGWN